jgi:hypothetical protein
MLMTEWKLEDALVVEREEGRGLFKFSSGSISATLLAGLVAVAIVFDCNTSQRARRGVQPRLRPLENQAKIPYPYLWKLRYQTASVWFYTP